MKKLLIGLALAGMLSGCTPATEETSSQAETADQTQSQTQTEDEGEVADSDEEALQRAYGDNLAEIRMAELAQEKSGDEEVRKLATTIEEEHESANQRLRALSSNLSVDLSEDIPEEQEEILENLSELSGEEFDRQFVSTQIELHQKALEFYRYQATASRDSQLKTYFQQTTPALESHLEAARKQES